MLLWFTVCAPIKLNFPFCKGKPLFGALLTVYQTDVWSVRCIRHSNCKEATGFAVIPYIQGVTEPIKRILNSHNVKVAQQPYNWVG